MCDKHYSWENDLRRHKYRVHNKIKFNCETCGRTFTEKRHLNTHINGIHKNILQTCPVPDCSFKAASMPGIKYHVNNVHNESKLQCVSCDYSCGVIGDLNRHISERHLKRRLCCPFCDFSAKRRYILEKHKIKEHSEL